MQYITPVTGLLTITIIGLIAVKVGLAKRPTFKDIEKTYTRKDVCSEVHKNVEEKLKCIPEIKETVIEIRTILNERKTAEKK